MASKKTKAFPKTINVNRKRYAAVVAAVFAGLKVLDDMEQAGAIRLPFPGYPEAVKRMREAVE